MEEANESVGTVTTPDRDQLLPSDPFSYRTESRGVFPVSGFDASLVAARGFYLGTSVATMVLI